LWLSIFGMAETCPVSDLPAPTGPYAVGTAILPIQSLASAGTKPSRFQVQVWYPAEKKAHGTTAPYIPWQPLLKAMKEQQYYGQPECVFEAWGRMTTHALLDAPANSERKFPLIFLMPGLGLSRASYTSFAEQFANNGNVVITVDFSNGGFMVLPDGSLEQSDAGGDDASSALLVNEWAHDALDFQSKLLSSKSAYQLPHGLWSHIDRERVAAMGHSLGGAAALQMCQMNSQVRVCVDLDGSPFGEVAEKGLTPGALILLSHIEYTDEELAAKGRTREKWDALGKQRTAEWQKTLSPSGGAAWALSVDGTGHLSFSDGPFTMPNTLTRFGGRQIEPKRGLSIIVAIVEEYMHSILAGSSPFNPTKYPEIKIVVSREAKR
jgi:dienelactone hydrolase